MVSGCLFLVDRQFAAWLLREATVASVEVDPVQARRLLAWFVWMLSGPLKDNENVDLSKLKRSQSFAGRSGLVPLDVEEVPLDDLEVLGAPLPAASPSLFWQQRLVSPLPSSPPFRFTVDKALASA